MSQKAEQEGRKKSARELNEIGQRRMIADDGNKAVYFPTNGRLVGNTYCEDSSRITKKK